MGVVEELENLGEAEVLRGMAKGLHGQPGSQVRSQVEAWLRLKEFERTQLPIGGKEPNIPLIFLSYDTRDIELVHYIDSILKRVFQERIKTFIAQRDIKPGQAAFQRMLHDSLAKSRLVLALCTKRSLTSPWLWFESGAGFGRGDFIPMLSGVTPEAIKPPMNIFQGKSLDNKPHIEQLLARVAEITGTQTETTITDDEFNRLIEISQRLDSLKEEIKKSELHLTIEGQTLLKKAAIGENGSILITTDWHGTTITTDRFEIRTNDPPRRKAKYLKAFDDLVTFQLIHACDSDNKLFQVTDLGYEVADSINSTFEEDEETEVAKPSSRRAEKRRPNRVAGG